MGQIADGNGMFEERDNGNEHLTEGMFLLGPTDRKVSSARKGATERRLPGVIAWSKKAAD